MWCTNIEGVGRNLQDHLQQRAIYKVTGVPTLNDDSTNLASAAP
jgi:choline dehydrogenase